MDINLLAGELSSAATRRPVALAAHTFIQRQPNSSFSKPVWLQCEDDEIYVVKGKHAGRAVFNDHTAALLGNSMGAPVPKTRLIMIPDELVATEAQMRDISPGVAHGSLWIRDTTDRQWLVHHDKPYNRPRFALLSVMYGWLTANDKQLIYSNQEPHLVYSVDHGHFFPNGPDWTIQSLASGAATTPNQEICRACALTNQEIAAALQALQSLTSAQIADAVAFPPDEWGVSPEERIALAAFLLDRQAKMINSGTG